jgi:2-hydroxy-3-oxopropionate reductase
MATSDYSIGSSIAIMMKDLRLIHNLADKLDAPMPITAAVAEVHRKLLSDGYGGADNSELIRFYRANI